VVNQQQQAGGAANANAGVTGSGSAASGAAAPGGLPFTGEHISCLHFQHLFQKSY